MDHATHDGTAMDDAVPPRQAPRRAAISGLLTLLLLVNLATSLYQLPLNRVVERRLCHDYYGEHDPSVIDPDGDITENLCKINDVQKGLAWTQGAMDTAWIVGGQYHSCLLLFSTG